LFRRKGQTAITLAVPLYSEAFWASYATALASVPMGSLDALCVSFYESATWQTMTAASHATFRPVIERLRAKDGKGKVAQLRPEHIAVMLDRIANPSARDKMLKALRMLMAHAIPSLRKDDPTAGIKVKLPKSTSHHMWTDQEIEQYRKRHPLGTPARLALEFALQTASRRMEVARLGPQHVKAGKIEIARCHGSLDVSPGITPSLQAAIDAMPAVGIKTFLVGRRGKAMSADTLAKEFAIWATEAGLPAQCRLHGLKRSSLSRMAIDGCTPHEMQAVSGHKTLAMIQLYTDEVDREKLSVSAFAKITKAG
jgi:integrase